MNDIEQVLKQRVRINYRGKSGYILSWYIETILLSILTLGFYLPVAANRLLKYLTQHTDIYMYDLVDVSEEEEELEEVEEAKELEEEKES
jgi:uncharacterized membrane protein YjgN (DUF898 family)